MRLKKMSGVGQARYLTENVPITTNTMGSLLTRVNPVKLLT